MPFQLVSDFAPAGGQPEAIKRLVAGAAHPMQTLLGITGSGKTFTFANVIAALNRPTLVISHNKTLAAQLYAELRSLFPRNRVEYFVSYYDYYQPESYLPQQDLYIEKDAQRNAEIERLRLRATAALMSRPDVIVVASVSCIFGLGNPADYAEMAAEVAAGMALGRDEFQAKLLDMQYERNDAALEPGRFRVRGDTVDVRPTYLDTVLRVAFWGNEIEKIEELHALDLTAVSTPERVRIFPAKHFVIPSAKAEAALQSIRRELEEWAPTLGPLERHRLEQRTKYDLEMIGELGYCTGIENYSRHFDGRRPGQPPFCLLDFFPQDFLLIIDESHQTIPQLHGMHKGDWSRKKNLVDYGFRLPSAFDNRPLTWEEFQTYLGRAVFVSATPGDWEVAHSKQVVEQIIRPTGLLDPSVEVRPTRGQIDDLLGEIRRTVGQGCRVLVTTLTKRMAEELTDYLAGTGVRARYLHSEIETLERTEIIRQLRLGEFDVLVGINLLREGLDIPEVALVAILDADKEGFLRNERSLIQTIGRASRNAEGRVLMYADSVTGSMKKAVETTHARRAAQMEFNQAHGIVPKTILKPVEAKTVDIKGTKHIPRTHIPALLIELEAQMKVAAERLEFEKAIECRDRIEALKRELGK